MAALKAVLVRIFELLKAFLRAFWGCVINFLSESPETAAHAEKLKQDYRDAFQESLQNELDKEKKP